MNKLKVFISHSSKDKPFVRKLKEDLVFNEIDTWVDEDELKVGDKLYETLILGLQSSSHFLIVLSNNIKGSEWVEAEINEALLAIDKNLLKKVIPVLLRKTEIPKAFAGLFRADFSSIIFTLNGDKVTSVGDDYSKEVGKIIRAIKQSNEFSLTDKEKSSIVRETQLTQPAKPTKVIGLYQVIGFLNQKSRLDFISKIQAKYKNSKLAKIPRERIVPVILPSLSKPIFDPPLRLGDELYFDTGDESNPRALGHFCGFASNNQKIVIGGEIRRLFDIKSKEIVSVEIDSINRLITFYNVT